MRGMGLPRVVRSFCVALALVAWVPLVHAQQGEPDQSKIADGQETVDNRIAKLEQQIVDLQVVIGTLQSLMREQAASPSSQSAPPAPSAFGASPDPAVGAYPQAASGASDLAERVGAIETQIHALSGQIEQMSRQMTGLQSGAGEGEPGFAPSARQPLDPDAPPPQTPPSVPSDERHGEGPPTNAIPTAPAFGTLTVTPEANMAQQAPDTASRDQSAAAPDIDGSRALYEQAYRHLLQRDFSDAEYGFRNYLTSYPTGPLAANAQYWLAETQYARGQYRMAADSFLKGYRQYRTGGKAPDSLLKLGMSLDHLGERDAACSTLGELAQNYPQAPENIRRQAERERRRIGC